MTVFVVVDSWQQQCCGEHFEVGFEVHWAVQVPAVGQKVRYHEEHHGTGDQTFALAGLVRSIRVLNSDLEPIAGEERGYQPVPGTGRLTSIQVIDEWAPEPQHDPTAPSTESFLGWIVELEPDHSGPLPG